MNTEKPKVESIETKESKNREMIMQELAEHLGMNKKPKEEPQRKELSADEIREILGTKKIL
jgi:hypothetical protein